MKQKIINIAVLIVVCFGLAAWGLTTVTGQHLVNSLIDSTPIGQTTPAAGSFTTLTGGYGRFAGVSLPAPAPINSSMIGWNASGAGDFDFLNDSGTGPGGFNWFLTSSYANNSWSSSSPLMSLGSNGVLSASGFTTSGNIVGSHGAFGTISGALTGNVNGNVTGNVNGNVSGSAGSLAADPPNCQSDQAASGINQTGTPTCGPRMQYASTTSCTTGSSSYNACNLTGTFPQAFPDNSYGLVCQLVSASDPRAYISSTQVKGAQSFTVQLVTGGSISVSAQADCIAIHN